MHDTLLKFLKVPFHQFLWKKGYRNGLEHLRWTMAVLCSRFLRYNTGALKISGEIIKISKHNNIQRLLLKVGNIIHVYVDQEINLGVTQTQFSAR